MVIQLRVVIALLCSARSAALVRPVPGHARAPLQRQQGASRTVMRADEMSSPLSDLEMLKTCTADSCVYAYFYRFSISCKWIEF